VTVHLAVSHAARRAARLLLSRPGMGAWAIGAVTAALIAFAVAQLLAVNIEAWGRARQRPAGIVVYLVPEAGADAARALAAQVGAVAGVERALPVAPAETAARLRAALGDRGDLLEGIDPATLPASLEITLAAGVGDVAGASPVVELLRRAPAVADVELSAAIESVDGVIAAVRSAAWSLAALFGALAVWMIAATLRLALGTSADEARIARLFGAPAAFVRAPAMLAGAAQGATGAALAIVGAWLVHRTIGRDLAVAIGRIVDGAGLSFFSTAQLGLLIGAGAALGLAGGFFATRSRALA